MQTETPSFRVRYADTYAQGVAYYGSYFTWQEVGHCHFLESHGFPVPAMGREGLILSVAESYLRYSRPAVYDDLLTVRTRLVAAAPKRFLLENDIVRVEDGEVLAVGRLSYVFLTPAGEVQPLPKRLTKIAGERVDRVVVSDRVVRKLVHTPPGVPEYTHELRVRYADTDEQGVAYYGSYFVWFEDGCNEVTRCYGLPYCELERQGTLLPVVEAYCRYHTPLHAGDRFLMTTAVTALGKARITFTNRLTTQDGHTVAVGYTVNACTGHNGRPQRLPNQIVERLGLAT